MHISLCALTCLRHLATEISSLLARTLASRILASLHNCILPYVYASTLAYSHTCILASWPGLHLASLHACILARLHTDTPAHYHICFHTGMLANLPLACLRALVGLRFTVWRGQLLKHWNLSRRFARRRPLMHDWSYPTALLKAYQSIKISNFSACFQRLFWLVSTVPFLRWAKTEGPKDHPAVIKLLKL